MVMHLQGRDGGRWELGGWGQGYKENNFGTLFKFLKFQKDINALPIQKKFRSVSNLFKDQFQPPIKKRWIFASLARLNTIQSEGSAKILSSLAATSTWKGFKNQVTLSTLLGGTLQQHLSCKSQDRLSLLPSGHQEHKGSCRGQWVGWRWVSKTQRTMETFPL